MRRTTGVRCATPDSPMTSPRAPQSTPTPSSRSTRTDRSPSSDQNASGKDTPVGSSSLKREVLGIALLLFSIFLAGALGALALAQLRAGVSVEASVGAVGKFLAHPLVVFFGWPAAVLIPLVP